jgi:L-lactate dehydrogenase complex protein LldF
MLTNLSEAKDLPYASSLCGACKEACPVKINLPRMLLYLRHQLAEGDNYPEHRTSTTKERLAMKAWRIAASNPFTVGIANRLGRLAQPLLASRSSNKPSSSPLAAWTRYRSLPKLSAHPFRKRWKS